MKKGDAFLYNGKMVYFRQDQWGLAEILDMDGNYDLAEYSDLKPLLNVRWKVARKPRY